jgi:hypothetical protein
MRVRRFQLPRAALLPVMAATISLLAVFAAAAEGLRLSSIQDIVTSEDTPTPRIQFSVTGENDGRSVQFLVTSSNPTLVPEGNVRIDRTQAVHTLSITPAANQSGRSQVELLATDGAMSVTQSFSVLVNSVNDSPTISRIADQAIGESTAAPPIAFTIGDVETPCASLTVNVSSSDTALLPRESIRLAGNGALRTLTLNPLPGRSGSLAVTVSVSDGDAVTSQQFQLVIGAANRPPVANAGPDQTVVGTNAALLNGTATDDRLTELATTWTLLSGPEDVSFRDHRALNTSVHFARSGIYTLRLTASDGEHSATDDITIVVAEGEIAAAQEEAEKRR